MSSSSGAVGKNLLYNNKYSGNNAPKQDENRIRELELPSSQLTGDDIIPDSPRIPRNPSPAEAFDDDFDLTEVLAAIEKMEKEHAQASQWSQAPKQVQPIVDGFKDEFDLQEALIAIEKLEEEERQRQKQQEQTDIEEARRLFRELNGQDFEPQHEDEEADQAPPKKKKKSEQPQSQPIASKSSSSSVPTRTVDQGQAIKKKKSDQTKTVNGSASSSSSRIAIEVEKMNEKDIERQREEALASQYLRRKQRESEQVDNGDREEANQREALRIFRELNGVDFSSFAQQPTHEQAKSAITVNPVPATLQKQPKQNSQSTADEQASKKTYTGKGKKVVREKDDDVVLVSNTSSKQPVPQNPNPITINNGIPSVNVDPVTVQNESRNYNPYADAMRLQSECVQQAIALHRVQTSNPSNYTPTQAELIRRTMDAQAVNYRFATIPNNFGQFGAIQQTSQYTVNSIYPASSSIEPKVKVNPEPIPQLQKQFSKPVFAPQQALDTKVKVEQMDLQPLDDDIFAHDPTPLTQEESQKSLQKLMKNVANAIEIPPKHSRIQTPPELLIELLEHQKVGVDWMVKQEKGSNKGGILADDMGLGKTIQTIATMLLNKPANVGPTLIVCPVSLLHQWDSELGEKVKKDTFRKLIYHGNRRPSDVEDLLEYNVVITTYSIVSLEWPKTKRKRGEMGEMVEEVVRKKKGILFDVDWHRIILDEGHTIKNKASQVSIAVKNLKGKNRWILTGTPLQNNIDELFSIIEFTRILPYCDWTKFKSDISLPMKRKGSSQRAILRVQTLLKSICLRRLKTDMIDNQPIITIPEKTVEMYQKPFTAAERDFYTSVEQNARAKFNVYVREGTVMKNYTNVLVLLLKLRMACLHPRLLTKDFQEGDNVNRQAEGNNVKIDDDTLKDIPEEVVTRLLENNDDNECPICMDGFQEPALIKHCGHIFCRECLAAFTENANEPNCPSCRQGYNMEDIVSKNFFDKKYGVRDELEVPVFPILPPDGKGKGKVEWVSSTKIDNLMEILEATRRADPKEKTIIFSQFVTFLELLEQPLNKGSFKFVKIIGSMSAESRANSICELENDDDTTIILVSLKCGSVGLNLFTCSQVVLMDIWWNPAIESQACDRVHRFGQKRKVTVHRLLISDSIEDRILKLQEGKKELFDAAMGEGSAKVNIKNLRLNVNDLVMLFNGGD